MKNSTTAQLEKMIEDKSPDHTIQVNGYEIDLYKVEGGFIEREGSNNPVFTSCSIKEIENHYSEA